MIRKLSIVLPIYNEKGSIHELHGELAEVLSKLLIPYEIIAVNDGSSDGSTEILDLVAKEDPHFLVIHLRKNYGQTAALSAGLDSASGDVIIPMDADLQNDPKDIPKFLAHIEEGYDVVAGWRKDRQDNLVRRFPSVIANKIISYITSVRLHDYGCTMKAYRRDIVQDIRFYGEMHRFMPAYAAWQGARIYELPVNHRARKYDRSKYGLSRTFRVILDLLTVKFLTTYLTKPMHFFGWAGFISFFLGFLSSVYALLLKYRGVDLDATPLPLLAVFFIATAVQFVLMGILAEILIRIYHEPGGRSTYTVRRTCNFK